MGLTLITGPTEEPLSLEETKLHLRVEHDEEDSLIKDLIVTAREYVEAELSQQLITATWRLALQQFPCAKDQYLIRVPKAPLQSVTSITYTDTNGASQTLAASGYKVDAVSLPGRIAPSFGNYWPSTRNESNAVLITFIAGYGAASAIPRRIKQAMKLLVGLDYCQREPVEEEVMMSRVHDLLYKAWTGEYM